MKIIVDSANPIDQSLDTALISFTRSLSRRDDVDLLLLDRANLADVTGIESVSFPSYSPDRFNAADSILLQQLCDFACADLFISLSTTPLNTPMLLLLSSMSFDFTGARRRRMEFELAVAYCEVGLSLDSADPLVIPSAFSSLESKLAGSFSALQWPLKLASECKPASFYERWAWLRRLQADTDFVLWEECL